MMHSMSDDGLANAFQPATSGGGRHVGAERTVVVHRLHDPKQTPSPVDQLLTHARTIVPAVLNYIYFGVADMAVVYFGKTMRGGQKVGVDGADDMKIRMLRFLTTEIWPQLLRTDVPDESQAAPDTVGSPLGERDGSPTTTAGLDDDAALIPNTSDIDLSASNAVQQQLRQTQRQQWLRKSLDSGMQVLVYLKPGAQNTKYLKLVLSNSPRRIHFDIIDSREEKFRWDNRMLHIRMLDNLETQKAIDSYETYERYFKEATAFASRHCAELERPDQPLVSVVFHDGMPHPDVSGRGVGMSPAVSPSMTPRANVNYPQFVALPPAAAALPTSGAFLESSQRVAASPACSTAPERSRRRFTWFENLEKPESLTLDYKSYFMHPATEIHHRAVKFMCGFLNGIGQGKLVVGVHEMERPDLVRTAKQRSNNLVNATSSGGGAATPSNGSLALSTSAVDLEMTANTIVTHNMQVEQLVVGIAISDAEIAWLQVELSEQLQLCIPPIPPQAVQLDVIPIVFPASWQAPGFLVLLHDVSQSGWKDGFRQKSNNAIRQLRKFGYSLCPYDFAERPTLREQFPKLEALLPKDTTGFQLYAVCPTSAVQPTPSTVTTASSDEGFPAALTDDTSPPPYGAAHPSGGAASATPMVHQQLSKEWLVQLMDSCAGRNKGKHIVHEVPHLELPELRILEISVNIDRCPEPLRSSYRGKFFNGWPSIPIWNPITDMITRVDRNYHIFSSNTRSVRRKKISKLERGRNGSGVDDTSSRSEEEVVEGGHSSSPSAASRWYSNASVIATILAFSGGLPSQRTITTKIPRVLQKLRLLNSSFNSAFEMSLGVPMVEMLRSTPVGTPGFVMTRETMSLLQTSLRVSRLATLPLLLVHVYEMLGSLLSPFPYVAAPVSMQSIRLHNTLVPLYMYHDYEAMTFRMDIVLDTDDGLIKVVRCSPHTGAFTLELVQGIGFAKVGRKLLESRAKQASLPQAAARGRSLRHVKPQFRGVRPPNLNATDSGMSLRYDTAEYLSPQTSSSGMGSPQHSSGSPPPTTPQTSHSAGATVRRLESHVPLLRFSFLHGEHQKLFHSNPWTLGTLLNWLHAVAHSPNVRAFGHCDRSFALYPDFTKEVCLSHLGDDEIFDGGDGQESAMARLDSPVSSVYASSFDCTLCRLLMDWNASH